MSKTIQTLNEGFNKRYLKESKNLNEDSEEYDFDEHIYQKLPSAVKASLGKMWDKQNDNRVFSPYLTALVDVGILSKKEKLDILKSNVSYEYDTETRENLIESKKLKEDYKISPDTEYQSKSGHKLIIKEVDPYISEYDGEANLRITYAYKLKDSNEWKTSKCNHKDFFKMLQT